MNTTDPYQRSTEGMQQNAEAQINELLAKGLTIDRIIIGITEGLKRCDRVLKRDRYNVEALGRKYELENKMVVAQQIKKL
jgi:hypothetical protein